MVNSINTNVGAMVALRNLNTVAGELGKTQNRVSTGLRVSSAKDDASIFSVAQGIRANIRGYEAVGNALSGAKGALNVGLSAATSVSNLLGDVKEKLSQLSDEGLTSEQREIYTDDLRSQIDQIRSFIENAEYNGKNILAGEQGTNGDDFTAYASANGINTIKDINGGTLTVRSNDLILGANGTAGDSGFVGLARLVYSTETSAGGTTGQVASDTTAANGAAVDGSNQFVARTVVNARMAQAALAGLADDGSRSSTAFFSSDTATAGSDSVFNSALASFEREVGTAMGRLGADSRSIELQVDFVGAIRDATEEGLGNLVDADLARESAKLQALQTKQQLSIQALAIANQQPTSVLALFN